MAQVSGFVSADPGQSFDELVEGLSVDQVGLVLGVDVLDLLDALGDESNEMPTLHRITSQFLHENAVELLAQKKIRMMLVGEMSPEKLERLCDRVGIDRKDGILDIDSSGDRRSWELFLGYFGVDLRSVAPPTRTNEIDSISPEFGLFPHQRRIVEKTGEIIGDSQARVVLHMPTGSGKTRTAMHVVCRHVASADVAVVLWLASSVELLEQAAEAFEEAWRHLGNRDYEIVRYWGASSADLPSISDGIVIAGLQKMHNLQSRDWISSVRFAKNVGLVVVDEAHQALAPTYRELLEMTASTGIQSPVIGLTATPGRTWSDIPEDERLSELFDNSKIMMSVKGWENPVSFLIEEGYLARPIFNRLTLDVEGPEVRGRSHEANELDYRTELLDILSTEAKRNALIVQEVRRLIDVGHTRIIAFGLTVRHAEILCIALRACGIEAFSVTAATSSVARRRVVSLFRKASVKAMVICNFGVLTTGFDAPNTSAAVIARPTKSLVLYSQMIGRAMRGPRVGGNATCEISTIVDTQLPGFGDVADAFMNWEDVWNGQEKAQD